MCWEKIVLLTFYILDYFGQKKQLQSKLSSDINLLQFMDEIVAPALGIRGRESYDSLHEAAIEAGRSSIMMSDIEKGDCNVLGTIFLNMVFSLD